MAVLGKKSYEVDNLVLFVDKLITEDRYPVKAGVDAKRGMVMKIASGKLEIAGTGDEPFTVLLQDAVAGANDVSAEYVVQGVLLEEAINYGTATADEFRDKLRAVSIITRREEMA